MKIAIVSSSFYGFYEKALLQNSIGKPVNTQQEILPFINEIFKEQFSPNAFKFEDCNIAFACVPGALEIPQAINWFLNLHKFDGILALGCVIKGKTTHFEHVCNEVMSGITKLSLNSSVPITSAIVTAFNDEDASERVVSNGKNLGKKAMEALVQMIELKKKITETEIL